jgi:hypothetical protein
MLFLPKPHLLTLYRQRANTKASLFEDDNTPLFKCCFDPAKN